MQLFCKVRIPDAGKIGIFGNARISDNYFSQHMKINMYCLIGIDQYENFNIGILSVANNLEFFS